MFDDGPGLEYWIAHTRHEHAINFSSSRDAAAFLDEQSSWNWAGQSARRIDQWGAASAALTYFTNQMMDVPRRPKGPSADPHETYLYNWVRRQRSRLALLNPTQVWLLSETFDFTWEPMEQRWERQLSRYEYFLRSHSRVPTASGDNFVEKPLAIWAANQKAMERAGRLRHDRVAMLESIPSWRWSRSSARYNANLPMPGAVLREMYPPSLTPRPAVDFSRSP
jgi:hypothetical protein